MKELSKENKVKELIDVSLERIRSMVDVNCVIGDSLTLPDGNVILPITKVSVGFVAGGGEYSDLNQKKNDGDFPMSGGTGGGYTVTPIGFFVVKDNNFKLIHADKSSAYLTLLKSATDILKGMKGKEKN